MTRRALLTGITGQDGATLAELLLSKGYEVHGILRRSSSFNTGRLDAIFDRLKLHHGDLCDGGSLRRILHASQPNEVYHLGAQSHVRVSFDEPEYTSDVIANGTLRLLEAVRAMSVPVRVYIASSSEMFGSSPPPQNEDTPFRPRSPYGAAKLAAHEYARVYRESYGMWIARGILFNHEGESRGETFVTRKITRAATRIAVGLQNVLYLGNLDARRDWGYAGDYCAAMWLMLQHHEPDDFVIATGESHTVREFAVRAFERVGLVAANHITHDPRYERPAEVDALEGDASKARRVLGWKPRVSFDELVDRMVDSDLVLAKRERLLRDARR